MRKKKQEKKMIQLKILLKEVIESTKIKLNFKYEANSVTHTCIPAKWVRDGQEYHGQGKKKKR
jgi:hypothetical protein